MPHRTKYDPIFERLAQWTHQWIEVSPEDIGGTFPGQKQTRIIMAARARGLRLKTSYRVGQPFLVCIDHSQDEAL